MSPMAKHPASPAQAGEAGEWYLIQTRPRQEARAYEHLTNQGFEVFFPKFLVARLSKGQETQRQEPLFPNYLFVYLRAGVDNWSPIRSTRGVLRMVTFGGRPRPVAATIIEAIQDRLQDMQTTNALSQGDKLLVSTSDDPKAALEAVFQRYDGEERVIVLLTFLQRQQEVSVKLSQITTL